MTPDPAIRIPHSAFEKFHTPNSTLRTSLLAFPYLRVADLASEIRREAHDRGRGQGKDKHDDHEPLGYGSGTAKKK